MADVTGTGYVLKTENEYFDEETALYKGIDSAWNLEPSTPDGIKIASDAEIFAEMDETLHAAYNSKDPNKARGVDLDIVSALTGTTRGQGTPSTVELTLYGVDGTVVPGGALVESTADGSQWAIDVETIIPVAGEIASSATCTVNGATEASIGTLTKIVNTVGGWQSVDNLDIAVLGTNIDSDAELRLERRRSVSRPGNNQVDSMLGEILATEGVRKAIIYENDDTPTDPNGLPGHSIAPLVDVDAANYYAVALSIYIKKNPGVKLYGAGTPVTIEVTSPKYVWQKKNITFGIPDKPEPVVVVDVIDDGTLPANAADLIAQAIIDYAAGDLDTGGDGFNNTGFAIGEDVAYSRLFTPVNFILGSFGNSYVTSMTLNGGASDMVIAFDALSTWLVANITVNIT